jgi:type III secretion protein R
MKRSGRFAGYARGRRAWALLPGLALSLLAFPARAVGPGGSEDLLSRPVVLLLAIAAVSLLPFVFMAATAFVKISTVLQIARSALGTQGVPSNVVVMALAGCLTLLAMAPVGSRMQERAAPLLENRALSTTDLVSKGVSAVVPPLIDFWKANATPRQKQRFFELARAARPPAERDRVQPDDLTLLLPAFIVSELERAFALGVAVFLPFLVIDLVVGNLLLALGMQMVSPTQVSLPFKLLLFVAVDGWGLLAQALVLGYAPG